MNAGNRLTQIIVCGAAALVMGCSTTLRHGQFIGTTPAAKKGPMKVAARAQNMPWNAGWGTFTAFAIPIVPVTIKGEPDRELMQQIKAAVEHCGYDAQIVENAAEAAGSYLLDCNVRRFRFRNYTYFFPIVFNWGKLQMTLIVSNPEGHVCFFNTYTVHDNGWYSFNKTVNRALTRLLNDVVSELMLTDFSATKGHICPPLKSDDLEIVHRALITLRKLNAPDVVPEILPLLGHAKTHIIRDACRTLAVQGNQDIVPAIEPLLDHPAADVRNDAQNAIVKLRAKPPPQPTGGNHE